MNPPRLRPGLAAAPDGDRQHIHLYDQLRITQESLRLSRAEFEWVQLINGQRSPRDLQAEAMRQAGGLFVPIEHVESLLRQLDELLFLDNDRFQNYLDGPIREPSCIGVYPAAATDIHARLDRLFTDSGGPGLPGEAGCRIVSDGRVKAVLVPHMDYDRGGVVYGWGFKELFERTDAALFVIIGTSHYSPERFSLTRKNFKTPLGIAPTDQAAIDCLVRHYGDGLFNDPFAHLPEHSIELEALLLQYLHGSRRPFRIVPLLVGSFADCVQSERSPEKHPDIARMVNALRKLEAETAEPICYVISGDLAHIGPRFDDPAPVDEEFLAKSLKQDQAIVERAEKADMSGYFNMIASEQDRRRICGLPPTWTTLAAARPTTGKLLRYDRYVHPEGHESVSFASMAFE
jgi:hypothetical protein